MNNVRPYLTPLAAGLLLVAASGCSLKYASRKDPDSFVLKSAKAPETLCVALGSKLTLEAPVKEGVPVQWLHNCDPIPGAKGRKFSISQVGTNDVGFYDYVTLNKPLANGGRTELSSPVEVQVMLFTNKNTIIVWGKPSAPGGGGGTCCPGPYDVFVNYKPRSGFGWYPSGTPHTATDGDTTVTCSKVEFVGEYGDTGCAPGSVTVPHPTFSPRYRFTIYFPSGCTPSASHPIVLNGFSTTPP